jgi:hypothetical protein
VPTSWCYARANADPHARQTTARPVRPTPSAKQRSTLRDREEGVRPTIGLGSAPDLFHVSVQGGPAYA